MKKDQLGFKRIGLFTEDDENYSDGQVQSGKILTKSGC